MQCGMIVQLSGMLTLGHEDGSFASAAMPAVERTTSNALNSSMEGKLEQAQLALIARSSNLPAIVHECKSIAGVGDISVDDELREVQGRVGNQSPRGDAQEP